MSVRIKTEDQPTKSHKSSEGPSPHAGRARPKFFLVRWWDAIPRLRWFLLGLIILLAGIRLCLPFAVERYVNHQLNRSKDYGGRIGTVHLALWRGRYRIETPTIFKKNGEVHVPLFSAKGVDLAIEWKELFHRSLVGQVIMDQPRVNFVAAPTTNAAQTGQEENWNSVLSSLFPFDLNRFEVQRGQVHFQNEHSTPPVDIYLNELSLVATNLTNSRKVKSDLPAGVTARSTTLGGGTLDLQLQLNPLAKDPTYQVDASLTNVDLVALNNFLRAYGKFDVERGRFSLYTSVASKDGNYDGYLKVFFENLNVFAWEKERQKNAVQIFWQAIVGTVTTILKNHSTDALATKIPISGTYKTSKVGTWTAIGELLRNAFIRGLIPKMDEKVTLEKVKEHEEKQKELTPTIPVAPRGSEKLLQPVPDHVDTRP
jgi:hypothetical protein